MKILRKIIVNIRLAAAVCLLLATTAWTQDLKTVADGVEFAETEQRLSGEPVRIFLLRLDPAKVRLDVHHAGDAAIGTETTSSIARRHHAIAAINAGFFRLDSSEFAGEAAGVLYIDKKLLSESLNGRIAVFIENGKHETKIDIAHLNIGGSIKIKDKILTVSGINREIKPNEAVLYTSEFPSALVARNRDLQIVVVNGQIIDIKPNGGTNLIPKNGFVLAANGDKAVKLADAARIGRRAQYFDDLLAEPGERKASVAFARAEDITNGVSQLISGGEVKITWQQEKASASFAENRHPRTAIAKLRDGKILLAAVDGRQPNVSVGMTLAELAEFLLKMGATDAANLDGGGSTTMFVDGKVVNTPSDKTGERRIGDAILVTLRK